MIIPALLLALASPSLSMQAAAENWINTRHRSFETIHLAAVKSLGDLICAQDYNNDRYLIDARKHVTWVGSVAFSGYKLDAARPNPHVFYGMTSDVLRRWTECERMK